MDDFESFYRQHLRLVYAAVLAQGADRFEMEDLAQETFLRAWRHFGRLQAMPPTARRAWMVRAARNLAIDSWRRGRRPVLPDAPAGSDNPEDRAALRLDVDRALAALEARDREIVTLRYFAGLDSREIGDLLEMPEGTVRYRLSRCREQLAEHLEAWRPVGAGK